VKLQSCLLCVWLCLSGYAYAEGRCPEGYFPIGGAMPAEKAVPMGLNTDGGADQPSTELASAEWETRWGAIAAGGGGWGAFTDMRSESQAKKAAV
jgi:hypothetical protein